MFNKLKLQQTIHTAILESLGSEMEKRRRELEFELLHLSRKFVLQVEEYLVEEYNEKQSTN